MSETDLLSDAVSELYWIALPQFTPRRTALAGQARKAGDTAVAKAITALRKPTKAAFVVNRLFRTDSRAVSELQELGAELRRAQRSADAHQMRKLTGTRKALVDELTEKALETAEERSPSPALREEVVATLKAALVETDVIALLSQGTLLKSIEWDGFGFSSAPELSVTASTAQQSEVGPAAPLESRVRKDLGAKTTKTAAANRTSAAEVRKVRDAERAKEAATAKREKDAAVAKERKNAEKARAASVAKAAKVLAMASATEEELQQTVRRLRDELDTARQDLEKAKETVRRATIAQRRATQALRIVPATNS